MQCASGTRRSTHAENERMFLRPIIHLLPVATVAEAARAAVAAAAGAPVIRTEYSIIYLYVNMRKPRLKLEGTEAE